MDETTSIFLRATSWSLWLSFCLPGRTYRSYADRKVPQAYSRAEESARS